MVKARTAIVLAAVALASCSQAGHGPSSESSARNPAQTSGEAAVSPRGATQLSPAGARQIFGVFLAAYKHVEVTRDSAAGSRLVTGPEQAALKLQPSYGFTGPELTNLTDERVFVPRLSSYPRWFLVAGRQPFSGGAADFMFLLIQAAPGKPWLDTTELYDFGQPGQELSDLGDVATDTHGYATAVEPGDTSLSVAPGALSAGFSRYFDAAVTHPGSAVSGYSSYIVPLDLAADRTSPRYGWRIADVLQAASAPVYALRLTDGGAAVIYLTRESFSWTAVSATATLSAPQSAYNATAVPFPSLTQALHVTSVRPGLRITLTELDEHLAIDPPGSGTVADYFSGKTIAWTG